MSKLDEILSDPTESEATKARAAKLLAMTQPKAESATVVLSGKNQRYNWDTKKYDWVDVPPITVSGAYAQELRENFWKWNKDFGERYPKAADGDAATSARHQLLLERDSLAHHYDEALADDRQLKFPNHTITPEAIAAWAAGDKERTL